MNTLPKISVVTVTYNSGQYLEECIASVMNQQYPNLEYIIIDGASTDNTKDIIAKYAGSISYTISEPDKGPAEALNKGFARATGDIMCWLNSDDMLHPGALYAVAEVFEQFTEVEWVMGYPTWFNKNGACLNELFLNRAHAFKVPSFVNDTFYLKFARWSKWRFALGDFRSIQQESVFWRKSLWDKAGGKLKDDIIAFDLELWTRFFKHAQLYSTNLMLAGFRHHGQQVSVNNAAVYARESEDIIQQFSAGMAKDNKGYYIKKFLAKLLKAFYYFDVPPFKKMYLKMMEMPPYIFYNTAKNKFEQVEI